MSQPYDLIIIGAGSAGLTAAEFAAGLGAKVALVERHKIGGDCTWYGCIPSKALLHVAQTVHQAKRASQFGLGLDENKGVDMAAVRHYIEQRIADVYQWETPAHLNAAGIELIEGEASFIDPWKIAVQGQHFEARHFLIATGAAPVIPPIPGLADVPRLTNQTIFANERLPKHLITLGAGAMGLELSQAYRRLGARVTIIDIGLLPNGDPAAASILAAVFANEGIRFVRGLAENAMATAAAEISVMVDGEAIQGDMLLLATGRRPILTGLKLENAGIVTGPESLAVNENLQTNVSHIYGAGDVLGGQQLTHFAGWQGFQAARNALLPGSGPGFSNVVPWAVFTSPEVAQVGLTEAEARAQFGATVTVLERRSARVDRAVTDDDLPGFIRILGHKGKIVGATIVAARAGEMINEVAVAMQNNISLVDIARTMHAYPSYSIGMQRLLAGEAQAAWLASGTGRFLRRLKGYASPFTTSDKNSPAAGS